MTDLRKQFVYRALHGEKVVVLAREFGISEKTGHKILSRFREEGERGLIDRSRRPHRFARRLSDPVCAWLLQAKRKYPSWGAKKTREMWMLEHPGVHAPAVSTIHQLYLREGLVTARKRKYRVQPWTQPLSHATEPNRVWCTDFKGQFRTGDQRYCYPLTLTDAYSRYILGCEGMESTHEPSTREAFERWFDDYGLPVAIRNDNGTPFASARALFGLTCWSAWLVALGIVLERITPGCPQQNGAHERMHRTLKEETTRPAASNILAQQERFDRFVHTFNHVRPHEALQMKRPADLYCRSARRYNGVKLEYPLHDEVRTLSQSGHLTMGRRCRVFLSCALAGYPIGLRELGDDQWLVSFSYLDLGLLTFAPARFSPFDIPQPLKHLPT